MAAMRYLVLLFLALPVLSLSGCMFTLARCDANTEMYRDSVAASFASIGFDITKYDVYALLPSQCVSTENGAITVDFSRSAEASLGRQVIVSPWHRSLVEAKMRHGESTDYLKVDATEYRTCRWNDGDVQPLRLVNMVGSNRPVRVARRMHYLYTVPLDIVTLPLQAVYAGVAIVLMSH